MTAVSQNILRTEEFKKNLNGKIKSEMLRKRLDISDFLWYNIVNRLERRKLFWIE